MADEFNPYREWLGLEGGGPADYYELLGLPRFTADEKQIATAAERATTKVRSFRPGPQARTWSQLLDEIHAAKECLADAGRRAEYDERLRRGETVALQTPTARPQPAAAMARSPVNSELYPPGMAGAAPAHAEAPLHSPPRSDSDPPARSAAAHPSPSPTPLPASSPALQPVVAAPAYADLPLPVAQPLGTYPGAAQAAYPIALPVAFPAPYGAAFSSPATIDPMAPVAVVPMAPADVDPMAPVAPESMLPPAAALHNPAGAGYMPAAAGPTDWGAATTQPTSELAVATAPSAARVATQRRRQSLRVLLFAVVGCIALAGAAAVTHYLASRPSGQAAVVLTGNQSAPPPETQPSAPASAINSGPPASTPDPAPASVANGVPGARGSSVASTPAPVPAAPPPTTSPATPPVPVAPPEPPAVTREEIQALIQSLDKAKAALGEENFKVAENELLKAQSLAKLPKHQDAVARLRVCNNYVKQFRDAVAAAVGGMQAGETFKVGSSTQVSFVEGFKDKVALRVNGMNRTYAFNDLPPGLALVIADFKLPAGDPVSRLVKGAYLAVHKRADSDTRDKAQGLWLEAKALGADVSGLMPLLSDDYASFVNDATVK